MQRNDILRLFSGHEPFENFKLENRAAIFHYLWLCYAQKSELVRDTDDIITRQTKAAHEANLVLTPEIQYLEDERFTGLLDYFLCEIENNMTHQMLISCEMLFRECQQNIRKTIKAEEITIKDDKEHIKTLLDQDELIKALDNKGKLAQLSETTAERIQKYRSLIYKNVEEKKVAKKRMRPENV